MARTKQTAKQNAKAPAKSKSKTNKLSASYDFTMKAPILKPRPSHTLELADWHRKKDAFEAANPGEAYGPKKPSALRRKVKAGSKLSIYSNCEQ